MKLEQADDLSDRKFIVSRRDNQISFHYKDKQVLIESDQIEALEIIPFEYMGDDFIAVAVTFASEGESLRYRMITSHQSESDWLFDAAERVGGILGHAPTNHVSKPT
jgi:hypothetical protein